MTPEINLALENLEIWDADEHMDISYVKSSPLYNLLDKIYAYDRDTFELLLYNICQRVVPSWEFNCKDERLRPILFSLRKYIIKTLPAERLEEFSSRIRSPKIDCTYTDTSGASDTLYNTIQAIVGPSSADKSNNVLFATYAVSSGETANTGPGFEKWFVETAIPISFDKRICSIEDTMKYTYKEYEPYFFDLFQHIEKS